MNDWPVLQKSVEAVQSTALQPSWWRRLLQRSHHSKLPPGVYIVIYHSIVEPNDRQGWEHHYRKGEVTAERFARQLDILSELMTPIPLSQVPSLWEQGGPDRPYFVVTFDDGYQNNWRVAHPLVRARGISPAVFVNGAFAEGGVLYRILVAILVKTGLASPLALALQEQVPAIPWSREPQLLFDQTKTHYQAELLETCVEQVYRDHVGELVDLNAHLSVDQVRILQREGWEIGNHTFGHRILSALSPEAVAQSIIQNADFWQAHKIPLIPFLAYPCGRAKDVQPFVRDFLQTTPKIHGLFAAGGVNLFANQIEWLRFGLGQADDRKTILAALDREVARTKKAIEHIF
ncbi:MAG: polysaccharide deacetylase family protein [Magnetococcales bacterium]|nr:polysaccharide deacetylase family protein [Magnetococcales bacterium]